MLSYSKTQVILLFTRQAEELLTLTLTFAAEGDIEDWSLRTEEQCGASSKTVQSNYQSGRTTYIANWFRFSSRLITGKDAFEDDILSAKLHKRHGWKNSIEFHCIEGSA